MNGATKAQKTAAAALAVRSSTSHDRGPESQLTPT